MYVHSHNQQFLRKYQKVFYFLHFTGKIYKYKYTGNVARHYDLSFLVFYPAAYLLVGWSAAAVALCIWYYYCYYYYYYYYIS